MDKIAQHIRNLLAEDGLEREKIFVALSGGGDSMALLEGCLEASLRPIALHVNFHLRGEESDGDEAFVREECRKRGVEIRVKSFDTAKYAEERGVSIEMAARELRYEWFREECGGGLLLVAHNADDVAETILLNLVRGTGISGLCGIRERSGRIYRPLLHFRHSELLEYLERRGVPHREDSTNSENIIKRNKIRNLVIPILKELNPAIVETLCKNGERLMGARALIDSEIDRLKPEIFERVENNIDGTDSAERSETIKKFPSRGGKQAKDSEREAGGKGKQSSKGEVQTRGRGKQAYKDAKQTGGSGKQGNDGGEKSSEWGLYFKVNPKAILESPAPEMVCFELLSPYGFNETQLSDLLQLFKKPVARKRMLSPTHKILFERDGIYLLPNSEEEPRHDVTITESEIERLAKSGGKINYNGYEFTFKIVKKDSSFKLIRRTDRAYMDYDKIRFPLQLRTWRRGDRIRPYGMKGQSRLLSDIFNDAKINSLEKERIPLLCDEKGIVWIVGIRTDERLKITEKSERVLLIELCS